MLTVCKKKRIILFDELLITDKGWYWNRDNTLEAIRFDEDGHAFILDSDGDPFLLGRLGDANTKALDSAIMNGEELLWENAPDLDDYVTSYTPGGHLRIGCVLLDWYEDDDVRGFEKAFREMFR